MIKIQKQITDRGDKITVDKLSIIVNGETFIEDSLYVRKGEENEVLPAIYKDDDNIVFNHKIDKFRRHITFIHRLGNDKRFLNKNMNELLEWSELIDYVEFYKKSDKEQKEILENIRTAFFDKKTIEYINGGDNKKVARLKALRDWKEKGQ